MNLTSLSAGRTLRFAAALLFPWLLVAGNVRIGVDPRIELFSIVFRLAGAPEYTQGRVPHYNQAIDQHFARVRDHEAVRLARQLRDSNGVAYDAVMSMALHASDAQKVEERVPLDKRGIRLDKRWGGAQARPFLAAVRNFAREADFQGFVKANAAMYRETDARLRAMAEEQGDLGWFAKFFGVKAEGDFLIIPGLVNGGASYGPSFVGRDGTEEVYAIPGVSEVDSDGLPLFTARGFPTLVHEFLHSFANPLVDAHLKELGPSGDVLYEHTSYDMKAQAYGDGRTLLYESLVRAATVRYIAEHSGADAARDAANAERGRAFLWTPQVVAALDRYAAERDRYPDLRAFMPELTRVFREAAASAGPMVKSYEAERPQVISVSIPNGATDVDPSTRELIIRFDRPMRRDRYAIARTSAVPQPKMGKPLYDDTGTTLTVPITLEPGKEYAFSLNWPGGGSFASQSGVLLKHVEVKFKTAQ